MSDNPSGAPSGGARIMTCLLGVFMLALLGGGIFLAWFGWNTYMRERAEAHDEVSEIPMPEKRSAVERPDPAPRRPAARSPKAPTAGLPREGTVTARLAVQHGYPPMGWRYKPGKPYPLSPKPPAGITQPLSDSSALYGEVPLEGGAFAFAIVPPAQPGRATLYADRNRSGRFDDDQPRHYEGTGTSLSAASMFFDIPRPDGTSFPLRVWLWTSLDAKGGAAQPPHGFNFYAQTWKEGALTADGPEGPRRLRVLANDPGNTGRFEPGKLWIDWNENGKAEDPEYLAEGEAVRHDGVALRLVEILAFADGAVFETGPGLDQARDAAAELALEPIPGNLPPALAPDLNGEPVTWEQFRGKVVLVDFWATWCRPCLDELPHVEAAYARHRARGFEIVGVSLDKNLGTLRTFLAQRGLPWRQIGDAQGWDSPVAKRWRVSNLPATFLIGADGRVAASGLRGEQLEAAILRELEKAQ